jgi:hypothetical protein
MFDREVLYLRIKFWGLDVSALSKAPNSTLHRLLRPASSLHINTCSSTNQALGSIQRVNEIQSAVFIAIAMHVYPFLIGF